MKMHLAQLNVGHLVAPTDDPRVKDFMDNSISSTDSANPCPALSG